MRIEHHSWSYDLNARFPQQRLIFGYEGGCVAAAEADGKFFITIDEGTMADFLDENDPTDAEVLNRLKTIMEFDTAAERDSKLAEMVAEHEAALRAMRGGTDDDLA